MRVTPVLFRSGFSLIEALVVLAIGGMALAIIFSIGVKAGDTGFGLGRRALTAADSDIATSDLRTIIRSLAVRPPETFTRDVDKPIKGEAMRLEADAVMERATLCAPLGWAGRLVLSIEPRGPEQVLVCRAGSRSAVLMSLGKGQKAAFSYSLDGEIWNPSYTNEPSGPPDYERLRSQTVWVRLSSAPAMDVVEMATSSQPQRWVRTDDSF